jgi:hypothetical protein
MRSVLAIARASAALKYMLQGGLAAHGVTDTIGQPVLVSLLPPDEAARAERGTSPRLNLFLYHALPSATLRPMGLPPRNASGQRVETASIALDLRYMLTAHGAESLHAEVLIAYALQLLNERATLSDEALQDGLNAARTESGNLSVLFEALGSADPSSVASAARVVPLAMSTEEMSHLWQSFGAPYRPSLAIQVTLIMTND